LEHKKKFGQFFTPIQIANFMAQFCLIDETKAKLKILDPGCGTGILSCSLIEYIITKYKNIKEIELTAFESDVDIIPYSHKCFQYLQAWLKESKIDFIYFLCANNFILHNSALLENRENLDEQFDVVITNPPYFKISKNDPINIAAKAIIHGQQNIYSIFLIVSAKLLKAGGQLIYITPRSFTSGSYFRLFREIFFSLVNIKVVHLFSSRKEAFQRDNVLLENIIVSSVRKEYIGNKQLNSPILFDDEILISLSNGVKDIPKRTLKSYFFKDLVDLDTIQKIFHLPTSKNDDKVIKVFKSWGNTLEKSDIYISTGPVVAFRLSKILSKKMEGGEVPLIWLNNIDKMKFNWPIINFKNNKNKPQFIKNINESQSVLISNKNYIFLRRFSSKDDKSKLIASPYFSNWLSNYCLIGVENHLNYIYRKNGELTSPEILGLSALLNSKLFDIYFRSFNGNINVSATELRGMPMPDLKHIHNIGIKMMNENFHNQECIDNIVLETFKIKLTEN
jgi:adenine-specific DNA-methyltransferase